MAVREELFDEAPAPKPPRKREPNSPRPPRGPAVSRRKLLLGAGVATGAAVAAGATAGVVALHGSGEEASGSAAQVDGMQVGVPAGRQVSKAIVRLNVNGKDQWLTVAPHTTLAEALRQQLGLTGTKIGCDRSECSACTVLVDGVPQNSCSLLAIREGGKKIETIEGQENGTQLSAVQQAFMEHMGLQCGFCTSGQIMQATALLRNNPNPTEAEIRRELSGNLCKCAAYPNILAAVQAAAKAKS
jgi:aerobic-type carbon monoxide dehydrogenase small subunit (CoxS/CutS family)